MQALLDTHAFIWFMNGDELLPSKTRRAISDIENKCFISIASIWEMGIKYSLKKLALKSGFDKIADFLTNNDIEILPISFEHIQQLLALPYHHRDPFDRIIIAQGLKEGFTIITQDKIFKKYRVKNQWK